MTIPLSISIIIILIYCFVIWLLSVGLLRLKRLPAPKQVKGIQVTVVVPFRDEEEKLPALVGDLLSQSYPNNQYSVVLVNDHSSDGSKALLEALIRDHENFTCLDLPTHRTGKKEALSWAIQHASSEWIIQTDADCRLGPHFIASHMAFKEKKNPDLVAGIVTLLKGKGGFLEALERLDLLGLVGAGAGSFHYHRPLMCNGANLAYSRDLYRETRRFDPSGVLASGDDMFLMIGARKLRRNLAFNVALESMVTTYPSQHLGEFLKRRIRWGSKAVHYGILDIQLLALLVVLVNLLVMILPLLIILDPARWPLWGAGFVLKSAADFLMLFRITGITRQRRTLWMFFPVFLAYPVSQFLIMAGILFVRNRWKGRVGESSGKPSSLH